LFRCSREVSRRPASRPHRSQPRTARRRVPW
jgi:hypothetical protein